MMLDDDEVEAYLDSLVSLTDEELEAILAKPDPAPPEMQAK
ncbi:MAG TPA: hypothetical protein VGH39_11100 [Xanthobacteraceae bacterium]|jgi:hypothetical protein